MFVNRQYRKCRILDPFSTEGELRGEKMLYMVDHAERANLVLHLRQFDLDLRTLLGQGQCEVRTWSETCLRNERFDQDAVLCLVDDLPRHSGSLQIRLFADMGWAVEQQEFSRVLLEYEARANSVYPRHSHLAICDYDTAKFSGDVVIDVLRAYPMALIGGVLQVSLFFLPVAKLLEEPRSRYRGVSHG